MSNDNSAYPTVATIIGCPEQLSSTNGLVATPIGASGELQPPTGPYIEDSSQIKDPIQKALIDNICGNLPTKNSPEYIRCDVCKVDCNGSTAYKSHLSGSKHTKRLKEQEMSEYLKLPYIRHNEDSNTYSCTLCCATLNALSQIGAHIAGQKHRNKTQSNEPLATSNAQINSDRDSSKPRVDATPNLLFCATCNIHVNSPQQLEQHTSSRKHINKVNGRNNFRQPTWKWKSIRGGGVTGGGGGGGILQGRDSIRGRFGSGYGNTPYPKISHNFVPGGQFRPY